MPNYEWVQDGEKFALIGLDVRVEKSFEPVVLGDNLTAISGAQFSVPQHWQEWLGTIRVDELRNCPLFLVASAPAREPGVLDGQSKLLTKQVHDWFIGLVLSADFISASGDSFLAVGSRTDDEVEVRQFGPIKAPTHSVVRSDRPISAGDVLLAKKVAEGLGELTGSKREVVWRLSRCLQIYLDARSEPNMLDRVHQFVRCIEGLIVPDQGKTRSHFKSRTELFVGSGRHELMGRIFDLRSDVEHMHEYKHLTEYIREKRIEIAKLEAIGEWISRTCLQRILLGSDLIRTFGNISSLASFWSLSKEMREHLWGPPIDPLKPFETFNFDWINDGELGQEE